MTDEQPNLSAMSPLQARQELARRGEDAQWRDAYLSGSPSHRKDFDVLVSRAAVDQQIDDIVASAGTNTATPGGPNVSGVSAYDVRAAAGWLHDAGLSDGAISELLRGEAVSDENYRNLVEPWVKENMLGNGDWIKRLMAGGATERKQLLAWGVIKTVRKGAAAPTIAGGR
jgi:hypothetical protein